MTINPATRSRFFLLLAALALLAGCAAGGARKDDTANIEERAVQRWNYLIAHDAAKAYDYLTPGYRATITREQYAEAMNNRPVRWTKAHFTKKDCDAERCTVFLMIDYTARIGVGAAGNASTFSPQRETWLNVKGNWYYLPSR